MRTGTDAQISLSALLRWSRAVGGMTRLRFKPAGQAVPLPGAMGSRARATMTVRAAPWLHTRKHTSCCGLAAAGLAFCGVLHWSPACTESPCSSCSIHGALPEHCMSDHNCQSLDDPQLRSRVVERASIAWTTGEEDIAEEEEDEEGYNDEIDLVMVSASAEVPTLRCESAGAPHAPYASSYWILPFLRPCGQPGSPFACRSSC